MSISIAKAQAGYDFSIQGDDRVTFGIVEGVLEQYGAAFKTAIEKKINIKQVVGSGRLADNITPEITKTDKAEVLQIKVLDYYDYPNEGVKGFRSSRNAPNSPYQYRNAGVPDSMKASLKEYILSGKAKISSTGRDVARGIGFEAKYSKISKAGKSTLIDRQVATLGYLIKAFGIKATNYFTEAFDETFKDFEVVMSEAVKRDIVLTLERINRIKLR